MATMLLPLLPTDDDDDDDDGDDVAFWMTEILSSLLLRRSWNAEMST